MKDRNLRSYLVATLGIFTVFFLMLFGSYYNGETSGIRIAVAIGIGLLSVSIVIWIRRLTR